MNLAEVRQAAREQLKKFCRVCPVCDGRACAGEVPGMGGLGSGSSFMANIQALSVRRFNMRTIHSVKEPDTEIEIFGKTLSMPVLAAPMTGVAYNMGGCMAEEEFIGHIVSGSLKAGTIGMSGDGADPDMYDSGLAAIKSVMGKGIPFIKPRQFKEVIRRLRQAEDAGVLAVGMDIDGAGLITMALKGQPVGPKTEKEMRTIVAETGLPFIIKGVMTPDEAEIAVRIGAAAIVVSNHGGRVLDHTPGAAEVLPAIAAQARHRVKVLVDGGVRSGADVLKYLALGADAVLIGRPVAIGAVGGGAEGVSLVLDKLRSELIQAMLLTGVAEARNVDPGILFRV